MDWPRTCSGRLSSIIQHERRQHQSIPGYTYRPSTEMPHVGVKGFGAGSAKEDRAKHDEAAYAVIEKICQSDARIERPEHVRMLRDAREAKRADDDEP